MYTYEKWHRELNYSICISNQHYLLLSTHCHFRGRFRENRHWLNKAYFLNAYLSNNWSYWYTGRYFWPSLICCKPMMTSSNGNIFRVTGPLCGESTGHVRGIHRSPVNSPHRGQWCGALMFSLICAWISGWVNNREAGVLRRHRAHHDVTVNLSRINGCSGWLLAWLHDGMATLSKSMSLCAQNVERTQGA